MAKSVKFENDIYLDSSSVMHNKTKLSEILKISTDEKIVGTWINDKPLYEKTIVATKVSGTDLNIDIGVSVGCTVVTEQTNDYNSLFRSADKALYFVKKNGKHSCSMSNSEYYDGADDEEDLNNELFLITQIVEERGGTDGALWLNRDSFIWCYRLIIRFMKLHREPVIKVLFSVSAIISDEQISEKGRDHDEDVYSEAIQSFGITIQNNIRKSDIMMQDKNHYFVHVIFSICYNHNQNI